MASMDPIRLAIADDHPAIGAALRAAVAADAGEPPIVLTGEARTLDAALAFATDASPAAPDVLLCDLQLGSGADGLTAFQAARRAGGPRVIAFTSFERASFMRAVFEAGVAGFLAKSTELPLVL